MVRALILLVCVAAACAKGSAAGGDGGAAVADGGPDGGGAGGPDADTCAAEPCSLLDQCGCDDAQVCDLDRDQLETGATTCRDVTVPGTDRAGCASASQCAGGYGCLGAGGVNQCRRYCDDDGDCAEGGHCVVAVLYSDGGGMSQPVPGAVTCSKPCAVEAASDNGCPEDPQLACRLLWFDPDGSGTADGDEYFYSDCGRAPASGGGDDAACTMHAGCASGFGCLPFTDGGKRCKQYCVYQVDGAPGPRVCDGTGTCQRFSDTPTIGTTEYGYCD